MTRSRRLFLCSVAACALSCVARAQSDGFPSKTITLIVPFAPGGASDNVARVMSQRLSEDLGKPMVVDNRPGAGGNVAAEQAARQAPTATRCSSAMCRPTRSTPPRMPAG